MDNKNTAIRTNIEERELRPMPGMAMLFICIIGIIAGGALCIAGPALAESGGAAFISVAVGVILIVVLAICLGGLRIVNPNEALVLTLFGKYHGTIKKDGFFFVNPFSTGFNPTVSGVLEEIAAEVSESSKKSGTSRKKKSTSKKVSTKTITLNNAQQKVNDVQGNPIIIGSIVIWRVANPTKAVFNVENYFEYLSSQCDSTIRNTARLYPYDTIGEDDDEMTLRGSSLEIAQNMKKELQEKVADAGIEIIDVRITHLAYS